MLEGSETEKLGQAISNDENGGVGGGGIALGRLIGAPPGHGDDHGDSDRRRQCQQWWRLFPVRLDQAEDMSSSIPITRVLCDTLPSSKNYTNLSIR